MSIRITNVEYKAATSSDTNNFLKSVTGEYGLLSIDFTAMPYIQPDRGISLTIIKPNLINISMAKKLFNIFSKTKKRKPIEKPKIIIDYREKNSLVGSELMLLGVDIEFRELKVADYIVKNTAIERKTVNDFITSMTNKRLLKQLEELQQYKNRLLIIEGIDEQDLYTDSKEWIGMHPNAIRGFLLSILLLYSSKISDN